MRIEQDVISLELENLSSSNAEVDLFEYSSNIGNSTTQILYTSIIDDITGGESVDVYYTDSGTSTFDRFNSLTDNDDFITQANVFYDGIFSFSYEYYSATESKMFVRLLNNNYTFTSLQYLF